MNMEKEKSFNGKIKTVFTLFMFMLGIQALRMAVRAAAQALIGNYVIMTDTIVAVVFRIVFTAMFIIIVNRRYPLSKHDTLELSDTSAMNRPYRPFAVFPTKFSAGYIIFTLLFAAELISTPFINKDFSFANLFGLFYAAIVTPIFEELIFRGYIWQKLSSVFKKQIWVCVVACVMFALWHVFFFDTIMWRMAFNGSSGSVVNVMYHKTIIGFCYGAVLGLLRLKTKNCYSTMLLHAALNIIAG